MVDWLWQFNPLESDMDKKSYIDQKLETPWVLRFLGITSIQTITSAEVCELMSFQPVLSQHRANQHDKQPGFPTRPSVTTQKQPPRKAGIFSLDVVATELPRFGSSLSNSQNTSHLVC